MNQQDDATSVPGSLFGNMPISQNDAASTVAPTPPVNAFTTVPIPSETQPQEQSYVDYYTSLGRQPIFSRPGDSSFSNHDLETSLLHSAEAGGEEDVESSHRPRVQRVDSRRSGNSNSMVRLVVILASMVFTAWLVYWMMAQSSNGAGGEPIPLQWLLPFAYQVSFVLQLEEGMSESGVAFTDESTQEQYVSFYSGMSTYVWTKNRAFSLVPEVDKLMCEEEESKTGLMQLFPRNLHRFTFKQNVELELKHPPVSSSGRKKKTTTTCQEWRYATIPPMFPLDREEFYGEYSFFTTTETRNQEMVPVRFSFVGTSRILDVHNRVQYHNYSLEYYNFQALDAVDPFWLQPPKGMPCSKKQSQRVRHVSNSYSRLFHHGEDVAAKAEEDPAYLSFLSTFESKQSSAFRRQVFAQSLRKIELHNRDMSRSYQLHANFFADLTREERLLYVSSLETDESSEACTLIDGSEGGSQVVAGEALDLVALGLVLPPVTWGSSWAVSSSACVEGQVAKHSGVLERLSAQNFIDCCTNPKQEGAFEWLLHHNDGKLGRASTYPFLNQKGFCHFDMKRNLVEPGMESSHVAMTNCHMLPETSSMDLFNTELKRVGPLRVEMDASLDDFFFYKSGVYDNIQCQQNKSNHFALAVGFDTSGNKPFTRIRNNWGLTWGEGGYARIAQANNICGVATKVRYVQVVDKTSAPTLAPSTEEPTLLPTEEPTLAPSTEEPTLLPTEEPTLAPTEEPTLLPTSEPTLAPTEEPTLLPTNEPTPVVVHTEIPTILPSVPPTDDAAATATPSSPMER